MCIFLVRPSKLYEDKILEFKDAFVGSGEVISGGELLDKLDFDEWLCYVQRNSDILSVSDDWVLTEVFFAFDGEDIVGVISFRHELNEFLSDWGHIGYSVIPSRRCEGIASWMLGEVVVYARGLGLGFLQLSCYNDNVASKGVIVGNGGVFVRSFVYLDRRVDVYRILL